MPDYPKSDHYDGVRFFNPTDPVGNGLWAAAKMFLSLRLEKWPEWVENSPALDLGRQLGADEVAITFVNHATVLVQTKDFCLLTDPVWSERVSPVSWVGPKRHRTPAIRFEDLPKIDFVVLSHNHYDHMDVSTLKRLEQKFHPRFLVPLGNQVFLEACGIADVMERDWWQSWDLTENLKVTLAPAVHFAGRSLWDKNKTLWGSYMISFHGHDLYFGADSAYSPHFQEIRDRLGAPEIAFLPIGAYEPRWFMKVIHMNPAEAVQAHLDLGAKKSLGIHFRTFQLTPERIDRPLEELEVARTAKNLSSDEFITLGEGRTQIYQLRKTGNT